MKNSPSGGAAFGGKSDMYLHIGQDIVVPSSCVVGVYDMDTATFSKHTRAFISSMERNGRVVSLFDDLPRSCIHCVEGGESTLYISQLSTAALLRRSSPVLEE